MAACAEIVLVLASDESSDVCEEIARAPAYPLATVHHHSPRSAMNQQSKIANPPKPKSHLTSRGGALDFIRSQPNNQSKNNTATANQSSRLPSHEADGSVIEWAGVKIFLKFLSRFGRYLSQVQQPQNGEGAGHHDNGPAMCDKDMEGLIAAVRKVLVALCSLVVHSDVVAAYVLALPGAVDLITAVGQAHVLGQKMECKQETVDIVTQCLRVLRVGHSNCAKSASIASSIAADDEPIHALPHKIEAIVEEESHERQSQIHPSVARDSMGMDTPSMYQPPHLDASISMAVPSVDAIEGPVRKRSVKRPQSPKSVYEQQQLGFAALSSQDQSSTAYWCASYETNFSHSDNHVPFIEEMNDSRNSAQRPMTAPNMDVVDPAVRAVVSPIRPHSQQLNNRPRTQERQRSGSQQLMEGERACAACKNIFVYFSFLCCQSRVAQPDHIGTSFQSCRHSP